MSTNQFLLSLQSRPTFSSKNCIFLKDKIYVGCRCKLIHAWLTLRKGPLLKSVTRDILIALYVRYKPLCTFLFHLHLLNRYCVPEKTLPVFSLNDHWFLSLFYRSLLKSSPAHLCWDIDATDSVFLLSFCRLLLVRAAPCWWRPVYSSLLCSVEFLCCFSVVEQPK